MKQVLELSDRNTTTVFMYTQKKTDENNVRTWICINFRTEIKNSIMGYNQILVREDVSELEDSSGKISKEIYRRGEKEWKLWNDLTYMYS